MGKKKSKNKTEREINADKYERQKKLAAERQRRFKSKMTQEELEKKRKRDRDRYYKLKEMKKIKPIAELKVKEQKELRKQWKKRSQAYRNRVKATKEVLQNTPPPSSDDENIINEERNREISRQKSEGRKLVRRDRSAAYRTIKLQKEQIKSLKRKVEKYKKRISREKAKKTKNNITETPSPMKKVKQLVGNERISPTIKRRLFLGYALQKQIKQQINSVSPKAKERQLIHKVIGCKIIKKYRIQNQLKTLVPYKMCRVEQQKENGDKIDLTYTRKKYCSLAVKESLTLKKFFTSDTVSKMCPGKKDYVRKGSCKKQRRILLDTMKNLYTRFLAESKLTKISYSTFLRNRPFWVTRPSARDRETCACEMHENFEFLLTALRQRNLVTSYNTTDILKHFVCSTKNEKCMTNICKKCRKIDIVVSREDENEEVNYFKWKRISEEKNIKGVVKKIKRVVKSTESCLLPELVALFKRSLPLFKKHVFYMIHQGKQLEQKKENIQEDELVFHVDFSQNYVSKSSREVQAMHFGASKRQISLHTGVRYSKEETKSFVTCSDNLDHHAYGVWAHMSPILEESAKTYPNVHTIHFFSDGPSSQYKNRGNVHFMCKMLPKYFSNLQNYTWNFSEHGHGKGAVDGVGGSIKRNADQYVLHGHDITCAHDLVQAFPDSKSMIKEISSLEVQNMKNLLPDKKLLPPIDGIMQIRQIAFGGGLMSARRLTCFECAPSTKCKHFHFKCLDDYSTNSASSPNVEPKTSKNTLPVKRKYSSSEKKLQTKLKKKKTVLKVSDIYSSSDEEYQASRPKSPIKCKQFEVSDVVQGQFVLVAVNDEKSKNSRNFFAIIQSEVDEDLEVNVMFMKSCRKDLSMFYPNENDTSYVSCTQVKGILPTPEIVKKGKRIFYKFKQIDQ